MADAASDSAPEVKGSRAKREQTVTQDTPKPKRARKGAQPEGNAPTAAQPDSTPEAQTEATQGGAETGATPAAARKSRKNAAPAAQTAPTARSTRKPRSSATPDEPAEKPARKGRAAPRTNRAAEPTAETQNTEAPLEAQPEAALSEASSPAARGRRGSRKAAASAPETVTQPDTEQPLEVAQSTSAATSAEQPSAEQVSAEQAGTEQAGTEQVSAEQVSAEQVSATPSAAQPETPARKSRGRKRAGPETAAAPLSDEATEVEAPSAIPATPAAKRQPRERKAAATRKTRGTAADAASEVEAPAAVAPLEEPTPTAVQAKETASTGTPAASKRPRRGHRNAAEAPQDEAPQPTAVQADVVPASGDDVPATEQAYHQLELEVAAQAPEADEKREADLAAAAPSSGPDLPSAPSRPDRASRPARKNKRKAQPQEAPAATETGTERDLSAERELAPYAEDRELRTHHEDTVSPPAPEAKEAPRTPVRDPATIVLEFFQRNQRPWHIRDLDRNLPRLDRLAIGERRDLEVILEDLVHAGRLVRTRRRTYGLPEAMNLVRARFQGSQSGYGFAVPEDGSEDYYISPEATLEAWNGDIVLVRPEPKRKGEDSARATVVRILERSHRQLVGSLEFARGYAFLKPDNARTPTRVLLTPDGLENLHGGERVVAELYWPEQTGEDEVFGTVSEVLGETDSPETETRAVIIKYDLRDAFPPEVEAQAEAIPLEIPESAIVGRLDLRDRNIFTVDGRDAKDFDDAIHIEVAPSGNFVVGVHIADVSHYVTEGSPLDQEALARATSVYLPGKVLPMLPERLSNGICSLVPDEDRLTLSAMIELNGEGDVVNVQLAPSIIRSRARLTYDEVQAYSEGITTLPAQHRHVEGDVHLLLKITSRMRQRRLREGSLDFKLREVKVEVEKDGSLTLIPIREETARGMIEDLMLLANRVVAGYLLEKRVPTLFRVHEEPSEGRFNEVAAALARMGYLFEGKGPTPQAYQSVLKQARGTGSETVVNQLLLRSLKQARYSHENLGHFGLAFDQYLHFTSPIRRYPDLLVHRMLRRQLQGELTDAERERMAAKLPELGEHTSERERSAAEAERDLSKYYQAKWAQAHLGETFEGTVSGVTNFGLFIVLENGVEGLLHISNLTDDYYLFLEDALMLKGRSSGRSFRLGDPVNVLIAQVNPLARQIDFALQENDMDMKPRARKRGDERKKDREPTTAASGQDQRRGPEAGQRGQSPATRGARLERGTRPETRGEGRSDVRSERGDRGYGAQSRASSGPRRIVTLERPRNEHARPVNVTVQRMYFGDWNLSHLEEQEKAEQQQGRQQNRGFAGAPRHAQGNGGRPQQQAQSARPTSSSDAEGEARRRRRRRRGKRKDGSEQ
ncbi:ribonuclease R [Deinobacterium chartae]|uniref:Ribonuclease R n=1 Tax=Deinobacterium chartae TaxID=521158 RepID=A0A841HY66_9DEIO|nr:ribonuclease R [Deinobacterium chartae]